MIKLKFKMLTILAVLSCLLMFAACSSNNTNQQEPEKAPESSTELSVEPESSDSVSEDVPSEDENNPFYVEPDYSHSPDYNPDLNNESSAPEPSEESISQSYNDFEYEVDGDSVTITKYNGNEEIVNIPEKINGVNVTVIGESAFENNTNIKTVSIPDSVTNIKEEAFYQCENLEKVKLSDNSQLAVISSEAFYFTAMQEFTIPKNCKMVYDAFSAELKSLYILGKETQFGKNICSAATTIYGYKDSKAAQQLSNLHGYNFEVLE